MKMGKWKHIPIHSSNIHITCIYEVAFSARYFLQLLQAYDFAIWHTRLQPITHAEQFQKMTTMGTRSQKVARDNKLQREETRDSMLYYANMLHVCMHVCIVCMYCMYVTCMHACMYCVYVCRYVCIYVCVSMYVGMYVCIYVCIYVCMYVGMYVCIYVCMYVYSKKRQSLWVDSGMAWRIHRKERVIWRFEKPGSFFLPFLLHFKVFIFCFYFWALFCFPSSNFANGSSPASCHIHLSFFFFFFQ